MTKLKGILLTQGMHGMISQVEGLAKALEIEFTHQKVELNNFWNLLPPKFTPVSQNVYKKIDHLDFDIIISCGRKSVIPSMRTPLNTIHYAKEFFGENHTIIMDVDKKAYLSALGLSENIVVTCDSSSMISEAALTGKPIYVANILPKRNDKRFQNFRNLFRELNIIRNLGEEIENWNYEKLDETNRVAKIINEKIKN